MTKSSRGSIPSRAARAADVLGNAEFIQAEQQAEEDVLKAMRQLRIDDIPYEQAAGLALTLVAKLQATTAQSKALRRLLNAARRLDSEDS